MDESGIPVASVEYEEEDVGLRDQLQKVEAEKGSLRGRLRLSEEQHTRLTTAFRDLQMQHKDSILQYEERVKHIAFLEDAFVDLLLETQDRHETGRPTSPTVFEGKRLRLKKRIQSEPVVIVESLRTVMRTALAFREDFAQELKDARTEARDKHSSLTKSLRLEINDLKGRLSAASQARQDAEDRIGAAEAAKEAVFTESAQAARRFADEIRQVKAALGKERHATRELKAECDSLKSNVAEEELKARRILELEEEVNNTKYKELMALRKAERAREDVENAEARYMEACQRIERDHKRFQEEMEALERKNASLQRNYRVARYNDAEAKLKDRSAQLQRLQTRVTELENELHRANSQCSERGTKMMEMKKDYDRLYDQLRSTIKTAKKPPASKEVAEVVAAGHHLAYYRARVASKESECAEMRKSVRTLMVTVSKQRAQIVDLRNVNANAQQELAKLRAKLEEEASFTARATLRKTGSGRLRTIPVDTSSPDKAGADDMDRSMRSRPKNARSAPQLRRHSASSSDLSRKPPRVSSAARVLLPQADDTERRVFQPSRRSITRPASATVRSKKDSGVVGKRRPQSAMRERTLPLHEASNRASLPASSALFGELSAIDSLPSTDDKDAGGLEDVERELKLEVERELNKDASKSALGIAKRFMSKARALQSDLDGNRGMVKTALFSQSGSAKRKAGGDADAIVSEL